LDEDSKPNSILLSKQNTSDKLLCDTSSPDFPPQTVSLDEGGEHDSIKLPPISSEHRSPTPKKHGELGQPSINAV
jgi:hypothetical protein